ncbi:phosphonate ABC transporter permease, partial [Pseudomonas syringae pv. syringae FF5]
MKRAGNLLLVLVLIAAVIASFVYLGLDLLTLGSHDNLTQMGRYASRFMSPDL